MSQLLAQRRPLVEQRALTIQMTFLPVLAAMLTWIGKTAFVLNTPLRSMAMTPWLIDDSFIFMRVARNLALGRGYSFDGITPTSGTPLLWTLLTSINHRFLGLEAAAKVTIIESAFFGAAATVLVFLLGYHLFNLRVAWAAFALSTLLEPLFLNALNGMGTALFTFIGLAVVYLYLKPFRVKDRRYYFVLGCLLGCLNLTRVDGIFLAAAIVGLELFSLRPLSGPQRRVRVISLGWLLAGLLLLTLPAVLWSLYTSGSPLPANQVGRRYLAWGSALKLDGRIIWPAYLEEAISNIPDLLELVSMAMGSVFVAGLAFLGRTTSVRQTRFQRLVGLYLILYFGTLVFYQGYFPNVHGLRYLNLPVHLVCILAAAFLSHLIDMNKIARGSKQLLFVGCLGALIWSAAYQYSELADDFDWVEDDGVLSRYDSEAVHSYWAFIDWLNLNLPPGTVVAAKDHGRLAYFTDLQVVDLAGILEPSLLTYMHEDRVSTFLAERQAAYVIMPPDRGKTIHEMIREQLTLEEIDTPAQELTDYRLYRIVP